MPRVWITRSVAFARQLNERAEVGVGSPCHGRPIKMVWVAAACSGRHVGQNCLALVLQPSLHRRVDIFRTSVRRVVLRRHGVLRASFRRSFRCLLLLNLRLPPSRITSCFAIPSAADTPRNSASALLSPAPTRKPPSIVSAWSPSVVIV